MQPDVNQASLLQDSKVWFAWNDIIRILRLQKDKLTVDSVLKTWKASVKYHTKELAISLKARFELLINS